MKLAVHDQKGGFADIWIRICEEQGIPYKKVNCYNNDIVNEIADCDALLWHYHHSNYKDILFAKQLMFSVEQSGKKVFPNFRTAWYFDDKVGQKYLLENIGAPLVPSYVFYDKEKALKWIDTADYPMVFKLRGGAGSANVSLIHNKSAAKKKIRQAFGKGFSLFNGKSYFLGRLKKYQEGNLNLVDLLMSSGRIFIKRKYSHLLPREKGYVYFQQFIPKQESDIRVIVIGDRAFGIKRLVLKDDFRASGSGKILYDRKFFNSATLSLAFETAKKLNSQCCAFDFIYNSKDEPLIVEISYGFSEKVYHPCEGYWDSDLNWHPGKINPQEWIIQNILKSFRG